MIVIIMNNETAMQRNAEKCVRNSEKCLINADRCRDLKGNAEKFREMQI